MVDFNALRTDQIYYCKRPLNLYQSPQAESLVTQVATGRYLQIASTREATKAIYVTLCEDDYPGWLQFADLDALIPTQDAYHPPQLSYGEICDRLPQVIAFCQAAMATPNEYLWGGTLAPNYDCSGLMQAAFAAAGIWLPRDAYQQETFCQAIDLKDLMPGDLVFFGTAQKATHVGLYLGNANYIHSSGKAQGRNGIGIDRLSAEGDRVSQTYYAQCRGGGRVVASYQPGQRGW